MKIEKGRVLDMQGQVVSKKAYTISKAIAEDTILFSLGQSTDITPERYKEEKLFYILKGQVEIQDMAIAMGEVYRADINELVGVKAIKDTILLEISSKGEDTMNIDKGKVFKLKDLIDYADDSIANLDLIKRDDMKFVLLSFDEGESLAPHSAPKDALVMALEGEAELTMGDTKAKIKAGEQFGFEKNIDHSVKALTQFKMALLLA